MPSTKLQLLHAALLVFLSSFYGDIYAQQIDETYNNKIKEYTTDKRFLPASVLNLPDDPKVPSPRKVFGDIIGAPGIMHHTNEMYAYYQQLAQTSPFLKVMQVGTTEEGRAINLIVIGSEQTMQRLDHYKKQMELLADPRKARDQDVAKIIADSKPIFYLNGGLHSPEMGSPEMLMELSYRLITSQSEDIKTIRDNI